jgi:hypothetical protein
MSNFKSNIDSNPLLQGIPIKITFTQWMERLECDPFQGEDITTMDSFHADLLLDQYANRYVASPTLAQMAYDIHRMLVGGLVDRHPHANAQKRHIYEMCMASESDKTAMPVSAVNPRGMLISGVTKCGKSRLIEQILKQYPTFIDLDRDHEAGWHALRQLTYLVIPMPTDASKSGFVMNGFIALDNALGTSYTQEAKIRNSTVDVQMTKLLSLLVTHRCGLLIIEEGQESHELSALKFGRSFMSFFLRIFNTGIPTILVGNPKAFDQLKSSSQLMGRISNPGARPMTPYMTHTHPEWQERYVDRLWRTNLLPEPDEPIPDLAKYLFEKTGGFVAFLSILRREATRFAVITGSRRVMREHIDLAMGLPVMQEAAKIVTSFVNGVNGKDSDYIDIPGPLNPNLMPKAVRGQRAL